jgi:hypothetical protein
LARRVRVDQVRRGAADLERQNRSDAAGGHRDPRDSVSNAVSFDNSSLAELDAVSELSARASVT